jgi:hypothetical protein
MDSECVRKALGKQNGSVDTWIETISVETLYKLYSKNHHLPMVVLGVGTNPVLPSVQAVEMKFAQAKLHLDTRWANHITLHHKGARGTHLIPVVTAT